MTATLAAIWRHPVKSLGHEALDRATLTAGAALPMDRAWALAHGRSAFDPAAPAWVPCANFLRVTHARRLAQVSAAWDGARLRLTHPDGDPLTADPETAEGAAAVAAWAAQWAEGGRPGPYRLVRAPQPMTDAPAPWISIHALASLRALEQRLGRPLDPRRFRGNLWLEGLAPWEELGWQGREIAVGPVRLRVTETIGRCAATEADPATGARDAPVLRALREATGDTRFGVYAEVLTDGAVAVGDAAAVPA